MQIKDLKNNCGPVAIQELTGASDHAILEALQRRKWRPHCGVYDHQMTGALQELGCNLRSIQVRKWVEREWCADGVRGMGRECRHPTIAQFCREHTLGVYMVVTSRHVLVIRNGYVVDPNWSRLAARRRVYRAWLVEGAARKERRTVIRKGEDPLVQFCGAPERRVRSESYRREYSAISYCSRQTGHLNYREHVCRLSELVELTEYTMDDAKWDLKRGRLKIVEE